MVTFRIIEGSIVGLIKGDTRRLDCIAHLDFCAEPQSNTSRLVPGSEHSKTAVFEIPGQNLGFRYGEQLMWPSAFKAVS